jgi:hypothetical protein
MAVEYTNRSGVTYYLREGKTKTGKPRYFFSSNPESKGELVEVIPEDFEIYEHPANAQVFLRKIRPQLISDLEQHLVEKSVRKLKRDSRYLVDCKDEYITIYESNTNFGNLEGVFEKLMPGGFLFAGIKGRGRFEELAKIMDRDYRAIMRFKLEDKEKRLFIAERFCFRGAIDDWIELGWGETKPLQHLVKRYIKALGTDAFYDLH